METSASVTTVRIKAHNQAAALKSLQFGCNENVLVSLYVEDPLEFGQTRYLARAFELLRMECEMDGDDLVHIGFASGNDDISDTIWPYLEKFVEQHSDISTRFQTPRYSGQDDNESAEDDQFTVSEAADEFFQNMARHKITDAELDTVVDSEGSIEFVNHSGSTPLLVACENYCWSVRGHRDAISNNDEEALEEAADFLTTHAHNLEMILRRNPDMTVRDGSGSDALSSAALSGNIEFVDRLLTHGAPVSESTLVDAVNGLSVAVFTKIAENHSQPAQQNLLVHACAAPSYEPEKMNMIRHLVEGFGCDVNSRLDEPVWVTEGRIGRQGTPLMAAALTDDLAAVQYLLEAGADVHALDCYLHSALHYCSGQTWVGGNTVQSWFARDENPLVIELLHGHGADALAINAAGRTPSDLAHSRFSHDEPEDRH